MTQLFETKTCPRCKQEIRKPVFFDHWSQPAQLMLAIVSLFFFARGAVEFVRDVVRIVHSF